MGGHGAQSRERQRVYRAPTDLELLRLTAGDAHLDEVGWRWWRAAVRGEDDDEEEGGDG